MSDDQEQLLTKGEETPSPTDEVNIEGGAGDQGKKGTEESTQRSETSSRSPSGTPSPEGSPAARTVDSRTTSGLASATSSVVLGNRPAAGSAIRRERRGTNNSSPNNNLPMSRSGNYSPPVAGGRSGSSDTPPRGSGSGSSPGRSTSPRPERGDDEEMRELSLKVLLIGPRLVGKTTIVHLITKGKFEPNLSTTVGVDFGTHTWVYRKHPCGEDVRVKAEFFDIMGQDRTPIIQRYIAKGTKAVLAVTSYPVTTESLQEIAQWIGAFQKAHPDYPVPVYLLVNKSDTMSKEQITAYDRMLRKFVAGQSWLGGDELAEGKRFNVDMLRGFSHTSARDKTNIPSAVTNFIETVADTVPEECLRAPEPVQEAKYTATRQPKKQEKCSKC